MYEDFYIGEEPIQIPINKKKKIWYDKGTFELDKKECKFTLDLYDIKEYKMFIEINYDYEKITLYESIQEIFGYKKDIKIRNKVIYIKYCNDLIISTTIDDNVLILNIFVHKVQRCYPLLTEKYINISNNITILKIREFKKNS